MIGIWWDDCRRNRKKASLFFSNRYKRWWSNNGSKRMGEQLDWISIEHERFFGSSAMRHWSERRGILEARVPELVEDLIVGAQKNRSVSLSIDNNQNDGMSDSWLKKAWSRDVERCRNLTFCIRCTVTQSISKKNAIGCNEKIGDRLIEWIHGDSTDGMTMIGCVIDVSIIPEKKGIVNRTGCNVKMISSEMNDLYRRDWIIFKERVVKNHCLERRDGHCWSRHDPQTLPGSMPMTHINSGDEYDRERYSMVQWFPWQFWSDQRQWWRWSSWSIYRLGLQQIFKMIDDCQGLQGD